MVINQLEKEKGIKNDIYNSKKRYDDLVENYINKGLLLKKPEVINNKPIGKRKYYCVNKDNFKYYQNLIKYFEREGLSYIRRISILSVMNIMTYYIYKDFKDLNDIEDKDNFIIQLRKLISIRQLRRTAQNVKQIGKIIFRKDIPEFFNEFKIKADKSAEEEREDIIKDFNEFQRLCNFFNNDPIMKAYLTISYESKVRPQELFFTRIRDIEDNKKYCYINISRHGKEGLKQLLCVDSYPYVLELLRNHKDNKNPEALLFLNEYGEQLTPVAVNKRLNLACKHLKIDKPITCYSIKRSAITIQLAQGRKAEDIAAEAGIEVRRVKTYDHTKQKDHLRRILAEKLGTKPKEQPKTKPCLYCGEVVPFMDSLCPICKRETDVNKIREDIKQQSELTENLKVFNEFYIKNKEVFEKLKEELVKGKVT